jgi:hypothetical protein
MERVKFRLVKPIYIDGRYGMHELLPITDPWKEGTNYHFLVQESYYRVIYNDDKTIDSLDLDGGPFMSVGTVLKDLMDKVEYKIEKFDCRGLYPVIICSKLQS